MLDRERPYWNMEVETKLNTPEMKDFQFSRLKAVLRRLYDNAPFYQRQFDELGIVPEKIRSFQDFARTVPPFDKQKLRDLVAEYQGDILAVLDQVMPISVDDLTMISTTTGTTGIPAPYPLTMTDIDKVWGECMIRGAWRAGIRSNDRALYCFALSMVIAGVPTMLGLLRIGATVIPVGAEAGTERILLMQSLFRGTVYCGTPSLAEYLIEKTPQVLGKEVKDLGIRVLMCGGEPGAGIPEAKKRLESSYGARVFDAGGGFGCSCDYPEYQGMHWLGDDLSYYELVNPETKESIPLEDGAEGEALITTFDTEGWVMLRNSAGDIHRVFVSPCPCGRTGFRYKIIGRTDDMLKVKGVIVYPNQIKAVVNTLIPRLTGEFRIVLTEKPPRVVPPLKIKIEKGEGVTDETLPALEGELKDAFHTRAKFTPEIIWVNAGDLERSTYKGQVFEKLYKSE